MHNPEERLRVPQATEVRLTVSYVLMLHCPVRCGCPLLLEQREVDRRVEILGLSCIGSLCQTLSSACPCHRVGLVASAWGLIGFCGFGSSCHVVSTHT
jgi:hypothetical protein